MVGLYHMLNYSTRDFSLLVFWYQKTLSSFPRNFSGHGKCVLAVLADLLPTLGRNCNFGIYLISEIVCRKTLIFNLTRRWRFS